MAGFADLVVAAQPALVGGGCRAEVTENCTYSRTFNVYDNAGTAVDLTGATITCTVRSKVDGSPVLVSGSPMITGTPTTTGFTLTASATTMSNLVTGTTAVEYAWACSLTLSGQTVQAWYPENSPFVIRSN